MKRLIAILIAAGLVGSARANPPPKYLDIDVNWQQAQELEDLYIQQGADMRLRVRPKVDGKWLDLTSTTARWEARETPTNSAAYQATSNLTSNEAHWIQIELDSDQTGTSYTNWYYSVILISGGNNYPIGVGRIHVQASDWAGASATLSGFGYRTNDVAIPSGTSIINFGTGIDAEHDGTNKLTLSVVAGGSGNPIDSRAATNTVDMGSNQLVNVESLRFNISPSLTSTNTGEVWWNSTESTLNIASDISGVVAQVPYEEWVRAKKNAASGITNGQAVYISGGSGDFPLVELADATSKQEVLGIATHTWGSNDGVITTHGLVRDLDTSDWSVGDVLYVSTSPGVLTNAQQYTGQAHIAHVTRVHATAGTIQVHVGDDETDPIWGAVSNVVLSLTNGLQVTGSNVETKNGYGLSIDQGLTVGTTLSVANISTFEDAVTAENGLSVTGGTISGNGSGLTNLSETDPIWVAASNGVVYVGDAITGTNAIYKGRIDSLEGGVLDNGVISGCSVSTNAGGMGIALAAGTIQYSDTSYTVGAQTGLISTADASLTRWDLVSVNTSTTLVITAGTASATPEPPDVPANNVSLAIVKVPANDTVITADQIYDTRTLVNEVTATTIVTSQVRRLLYSETLSSGGRFDVSSISQDWDDLVIELFAKSSVSAAFDGTKLYFNNDTTDANYQLQQFYGNDGATIVSEGVSASIGPISPSNVAGAFSKHTITIPKYTSSHLKLRAADIEGTGNAFDYMWVGRISGCWSNTAAINRITFQPDGYPTDTLQSGSSIKIYGVGDKTIWLTE